MKYIHVKVKAGVTKESLKEKSEDHLEIEVKEKAKNNMANKKVIEMVAKYFKVPINKVRIVSGHHHPSKLLVVD